MAFMRMVICMHYQYTRVTRAKWHRVGDTCPQALGGGTGEPASKVPANALAL